MSLNGKFLDKDHLQYFWQQMKLKFATAAQGTKADSALQQSDVSSTYSASGTAPVNGTAVNAALGTLDVPSVGGAGQYISEISEAGGKISATAETMDTAPTSGSTKAVTSGGVQAPLAEVIDNGAKNRLNITLTSGSGDGLTWTVNDDLSVTVSGKNTGGTLKQLHLIGSSYIQNAWKGQYLSGVSGGGSSTYRITAYYSNNGSTYATEQTFYNGALTIKENDYIRISLEIAPSYEFAEPYTFKPMICAVQDWAVSQKFVPYAPTNRELYETCETKVTMQQAYGDGTVIPANSNLNDYITPGLYYTLVANVPTITNTPYTSTGFRLVVEKNTPSGAAVFQTLYPTSRTQLEFYRRIYEGGSWSSWYKFEGIAVT